MEAARRRQWVDEDAGDEAECFVPYVDVMDDDEDFYLPPEDTWPEWNCDECNQHNAGQRIRCAMCGTVREDVDQCG